MLKWINELNLEPVEFERYSKKVVNIFFSSKKVVTELGDIIKNRYFHLFIEVLVLSWLEDKQIRFLMYILAKAVTSLTRF